MKNIRMMVPVVLALGLLAACAGKSEKGLDEASEKKQMELAVDERLNTAVDSILRKNMQDMEAYQGEVIVMECATGDIKAWSKIVRQDSVLVAQEPQEQVCRSGLWPVAALLGALDAGRVQLSDIVDPHMGIYVTATGDTLYDHNWRRGGYGPLEVRLGFAFSSRIAIHKATLDSVPSRYALGTNLQILSFFNAIATGDSTLVDGNLAAMDSLRSALRFCVTDGMGKKAECADADVAGYPAIPNKIPNEDVRDYFLEFCGYFPYDKPKYTILVTLSKETMPASSGGFCGPLFRQVVEYLNATE